MRTRLPNETWENIVGNLRRKDLRTCLFVSRKCRSLALPLLFRTVHLHFGVREAAESSIWTSDTSAFDEFWLAEERSRHLEQEAQATARMIDILDAVSSGGDFARVVRCLIVHAEHARHACFLECRALEKSLTALPQLSELTWIGSSPRMRQSVVDTLKASCPELRSLSIWETQSFWSGSGTGSLPSFSYLAPLKSLSLLTSEDRFPTSAACGDTFKELMISHQKSLRSLSVQAIWLKRIPPQNYDCLTALDLRGAGNVDLVLQAAAGLQSLSLRDDSPEDTFASFHNARGKLPCLQSLMILPQDVFAHGDGFTATHARCLVDFIADAPHLRRFRIYIPDCDESQGMPALLEGLHKHGGGLRALGLGLREIFDEDTFDLVVQILGPTLGAFSLAFGWDPETLDTGEMSPLFARLAQLEHLAFLHIGSGDWSDFREAARRLPRDIHSLSMLSFGSEDAEVWEIDRGRGLSNGPVLEPWGRARIDCCGVEDFPPGLQDGEWLLRYTVGRGLSESSLARS